MSTRNDSNDKGGVTWSTVPITDNYMRGSDWRGKWRQAAAAQQQQQAEPKRQPQQHFVKPTSATGGERPATGGPVIMDWRKGTPAGVSPTKRSRPWSGEPHWHHGKGHHGGKGHHHQTHGGWQHTGEWQGEQQWEENGWWNWEGPPNEEDQQKWPGYNNGEAWSQDPQHNQGGDTNAWSGDGPWQEGAWTDQQHIAQGPTEPQESPTETPASEEPATKKPRSASKSPDTQQQQQQAGSASFVNALRKLFKAKNAAPAKAPQSKTTTNNPTLWEAGKGPDKPQGGGALTALLAKQASTSAIKAPSPGPSPGSPGGGPSDTQLRKNVLTRLLSSDNAGELLEDPKVVEMLLQVASQLDETGLADLQKSVVKIITKMQSSAAAAAAANGGAGDLPPDQLAKRNACVERLKAILEGLRGLFLKRQEERINQGKASAAAAAAQQNATIATTSTSSNTSHSALASLLSGVSAQNQPIYDHKVWTGYVQRSGVNKAKVNLYATLPVNSLTTEMVAQLGNELNLKLRVPDNEVLHQRQIHLESSSLLLMKADSAADQAELNAQIAYFNGRSRSGVAKLERDGVHYAAFMIPPGPLAEKLIGSDNYKRCNPDDMATVCMITKSDTVH